MVGTANTVLIREVSLIERFCCIAVLVCERVLCDNCQSRAELFGL